MPDDYSNFWKSTKKGELLEVYLLKDGRLYWEVGPDSWPARGHQGAGGHWSLEEFREPPEWLKKDFPEVWEEINEYLMNHGAYRSTGDAEPGNAMAAGSPPESE